MVGESLRPSSGSWSSDAEPPGVINGAVNNPSHASAGPPGSNSWRRLPVFLRSLSSFLPPQNNLLPPALPEQVAVHRHRTGEHPHRQRGVLHALRLRHHVEQSHRTVSLRLTHPGICFSVVSDACFDVRNNSACLSHSSFQLIALNQQR